MAEYPNRNRTERGCQGRGSEVGVTTGKRAEGFEELEALVLADYDPPQASAICGVPAEEIVAIARTIGRAGAMLIFWGMGVAQHTTGTDNARSRGGLSLWPLIEWPASSRACTTNEMEKIHEAHDAA